MPEYLAPGVYVEEVTGGVAPIPGVPTSTAGLTGADVVERMSASLADLAPDWTGHDAHDPGIMLLELLAFAAEDLRQRVDSPRARAAAARIAAAFAGAGAGAGCAAPLRRPRYFAGKLLTVDDLSRDQDYLRGLQRRHNLALHGTGVVSGLAVHVDTADANGATVSVTPGVALAPDGTLLVVGCPVAFAVAPAISPAFVVLRYGERATASVPADTPSGSEASEVEEIAVLSVVPAPGPLAVPLARLVRANGGWRVDPAFVPPRADGKG